MAQLGTVQIELSPESIQTLNNLARALDAWLTGRPIVETDEIVNGPIIVGGHWLQPGELLQDAIVAALERGLT